MCRQAARGEVVRGWCVGSRAVASGAGGLQSLQMRRTHRPSGTPTSGLCPSEVTPAAETPPHLAVEPAVEGGVNALKHQRRAAGGRGVGTEVQR